MARIIFRRLNEALNTVKTNLSLPSVDSSSTETELRKLSALMEIISYANSLDWLSHEGSKKRIRFFLNQGMDYRLTARHFNTKPNTIESAVSYACSKLEKLIGLHTLDLLMDGKVDEALTEFYLGTEQKRVEALFLPGVLDLLPPAQRSEHLTLEECTSELGILGILSKAYVEEILNLGSKERLAHVSYILNTSDKKYSLERDLLLRLFTGDFTFNEEGDLRTPPEQVKETLQLYYQRNPFYVAVANE